jgi:hypothetical protein
MFGASAFVIDGWRAGICARRIVYEKNAALGFENGAGRDTCQFAIYSNKLYECIIIMLEKLYTIFQ